MHIQPSPDRCVAVCPGAYPITGLLCARAHAVQAQKYEAQQRTKSPAHFLADKNHTRDLTELRGNLGTYIVPLQDRIRFLQTIPKCTHLMLSGKRTQFLASVHGLVVTENEARRKAAIKKIPGKPTTPPTRHTGQAATSFASTQPVQPTRSPTPFVGCYPSPAGLAPSYDKALSFLPAFSESQACSTEEEAGDEADSNVRSTKRGAAKGGARTPRASPPTLQRKKTTPDDSTRDADADAPKTMEGTSVTFSDPSPGERVLLDSRSAHLKEVGGLFSFKWQICM
jgi:hypothetical protein